MNNKTEETLIKIGKGIVIAVFGIFAGKKVKQHFNNNNNQQTA